MIKNTQKRLCKSVIKGADNKIILNYLSDEFRKFLSYLTNENCCSMTSGEFGRLSTEPEFLCKFFKECDTLRFSGKEIDSHDVLNLLADLNDFIKAASQPAQEAAA